MAVLLGARSASAALSDVCGRPGRSGRRARLCGAELVDRVGRRGDQAGPATGAVSVLATRGVAAAEPYLTRYLPALVLACVLPPLTVVAIATQDLLSAVIVLATLPLVPVFGALVGLATRDRAREQWRAMAALSGHFLDVVRGLPTLVAYRRARAQSGRIARDHRPLPRATLRTLRIAFASSAVLELVATLSVALVAVTAASGWPAGRSTCTPRWSSCCWRPRPTGRCAGSARSSTPPPRAPRPSRRSDAAHTQAADRGHPAPGPGPRRRPAGLRDVSVTHDGRNRPAVADLDAVLPATGVTGVTGPSGCGKSTLLAALAGLLPLSGGAVTADGHRVGGPAWQAQVAWLPQRPQFVRRHASPTTCGWRRPDAADEQLWSALRRVALEERVRELPGGLESPLGEDGATLSAGERARLALARVVVADRPWMLLDEPTAHLDDLTEQVIPDTIVELGRRGAVVVVAHRPALVELADHGSSCRHRRCRPRSPPHPHRRSADSPRRYRCPTGPSSCRRRGSG